MKEEQKAKLKTDIENKIQQFHADLNDILKENNLSTNKIKLSFSSENPNHINLRRGHVERLIECRIVSLIPFKIECEN